MAYTDIDKSDEYFTPTIWTGTGATRSITSLNFQPDFVWIKDRDDTSSHALTDSVRGNTKYLMTNTGDVEETLTDRVLSFNSDGFTLGSSAGVNQSGSGNVGWSWLGGGTAVSNTAGSITSSVSANTTSGFSIVSWTGTGATATVGHGLGAEPSLFILKDLDDTYDWRVYVKSLGNTGAMILNSTTAFVPDSSYYNDTTPTSTVFTLGNNAGTNGSGRDYIAYCFADVKGFSKFGSYTGNGSTDGTFVYTGFKPAFLVIKCTSSGTTQWRMYDDKRDPFNPVIIELNANTNDADNVSARPHDFLSNGFKMRDTNINTNGSGETYIYMAFAENPFVTSTSIPTTAR
jgi:hypothetical protein